MQFDSSLLNPVHAREFYNTLHLVLLTDSATALFVKLDCIHILHRVWICSQQILCSVHMVRVCTFCASKNVHAIIILTAGVMKPVNNVA